MLVALGPASRPGRTLPKTRVWGSDLPDPPAALGEPPVLAAIRIWPGAGVTTTTRRGVPDYLRNRYYDPSTGQFISRDPRVSTTRQPYSYVGDNPLNGADPSGLFTVGLCTGFDFTVPWLHVSFQKCAVSDGYHNLITETMGTHASQLVGAGVQAPTLQISSADRGEDLQGDSAAAFGSFRFFGCSVSLGQMRSGKPYVTLDMGPQASAGLSIGGAGVNHTDVAYSPTVDANGGGVTGGSQGSDTSGDAASDGQGGGREIAPGVFQYGP